MLLLHLRIGKLPRPLLTTLAACRVGVSPDALPAHVQAPSFEVLQLSPLSLGKGNHAKVRPQGRCSRSLSGVCKRILMSEEVAILFRR